MNNNRGNNRRRGRGNNRQQGGQQTNRIDSRARGNAPQLLEKYRKLAHDAHLNGDRVMEEYYLQFADHYFRVIADQRQRQDESRPQRRDERPYDYGYDADADGDFEPQASAPYQSHGERSERAPRAERPEREPRPEPAIEDEPVAQESAGGEVDGNRSIYEAAENPFLRDSRGPGGKSRNKPRRRSRDEDGVDANGNTAEAPQPSFDLSSSLPPAFSPREERDAEPAAELKPVRTRAPRKPRAGAAVAVEAAVVPAPVPETASAPAAGDEKPKARRRTRKAAASEGGGDPLETVN